MALPFFAYGTLKPGQLGHHQVEAFVAAADQGTTAGALHVEDGLALFDPALPNRRTEGSILWFVPGKAESAYEAIGAFEPRKRYRWERVTVSRADDSTLTVNTLVGEKVSPSSRGEEPISDWTARRDPLLTFGLGVARGIALENGVLGHASAPGSGEFWNTLFRLESGYLLLCSVLERVATFRYGVDGSLSQRIKNLGLEPSFVDAVLSTNGNGCPSRTVRRSNNRKTLRCREDGRGCLECWYGVRSNISHQGKAAYVDDGVLRESYRALHDSLREYLRVHVGGLEDAWAEGDPTGIEGAWMIGRDR